MGTLAALIIPRVSDIVDEARINKTKERLMILKKAVSGDSSSLSTGYENDVGTLPDTLSDLITKPAGINSYDPFIKRGWNWPYIKSLTSNDYLYDSWNNLIIYDKNSRTITSYGADKVPGGTGVNADITVNL